MGDELIALAIAAHGGLEQWRKYKTLKAELAFGGVTWALKGQEKTLDHVKFNADLHQQKASFAEFISLENMASFSPDRVAIEKQNGDVLQELLLPRASFAGHTIQTPWNELQLIYFASYASWNYLTAPFCFAKDGFASTEIAPWIENGETLRRLEVIFPDHIAAHNRRQVFYFDQDGLLKRFDYWPEVLGGTPAVQYVSDYQEFSGIKIPTRRKVYMLKEDNSFQPEPVLVSIKIQNVIFE